MKRHDFENLPEVGAPISGIELPKPQLEQAKTVEPIDEVAAAKAVELASASGLPAPVIATNQAAPQPQSSAGAAPTIPIPAIPAIADDNDLIEKEWITKAKQIVNKTRDDPHAQNIEMNKYKATYIKKRFNKDIKLTET